MICRLISISIRVNATIQTIIENASFVIVKHHTAKKQNGECTEHWDGTRRISNLQEMLYPKKIPRKICAHWGKMRLLSTRQNNSI